MKFWHKTTFPLTLLICMIGLSLGCKSTPEAIRVMPVDTRYQDMDALKAIDAFIANANIDKRDPDWKRKLPRPPRVRFDPEKKYYWLLRTNLGDVKVELLTIEAPMHASNTIYLSRLGFYDGLTFHRIIPKFMAQGGDPAGDGSGGPGYRIAGEFEGEHTHDDQGVISAANRGPRTDGSQFFITFAKADHLDGKHTVYGVVTEGIGTVRDMELRGSETGKPRSTIRINRSLIRVE